MLLLASLWHHFGLPVSVGILALPFAALLVAYLTARRRRAGIESGWALRSALAEIAIVVGTVPWVWLVLTPNPGHVRGYNLVPFRDLLNQFHVGLGFAVEQIGGNLLVFAAFGFFAPILLAALLSHRWWRSATEPE